MRNEMLNTYSPFTDAINNRFPLVNAIIVKENKTRHLCINNYILHRQIGRGSYAQVRSAWDVYQEEDVALRILNRKQLSKKLGTVKRTDGMINNSLKIMAILDTKYIVQCKEFLYTNILLCDLSSQTKSLPISHELAKQFVELPQIIGELAEQEDDEVELFQQQITPRFTQDLDNMQNVCVFVLEKADTSLLEQTQVADYNMLRSFIYQAISGVNHMHQNRMVYNDLKAENLLIFQQKNQLKLSDFDTSQILPDIETSITLDQLHEIEGVKQNTCNSARGYQSISQSNNLQYKNQMVQFPQHITHLIVDQMLYNHSISEIGFQTPGIAAPESRSGTVHVGELSDMWQFGQLLLNVFLGTRTNFHIQKHSTDEQLIAKYYNNQLADLIVGSTLPQTLRYTSDQAIMHPFFTNRDMQHFTLEHIESKFNIIVQTIQKHKIHLKRSLSARCQADQRKQQKNIFQMLRQGLLETQNISKQVEDNEHVLPLRKRAHHSSEISTVKRLDNVQALSDETTLLLNYVNNVLSNEKCHSKSSQKEQNRARSVPIKYNIRQKISIQEFVQSSYTDNFSMHQLEELCAKSIKQLDVSGYKSKRSALNRVRKQLEMQQLVKLCIYLNYYKVINHVGQGIVAGTVNQQCQLPEKISPTLSVADYVARILRNYNGISQDYIVEVNNHTFNRRNTLPENLHTLSNTSTTIQSTTQIFKTEDIPAMASSQSNYNEINIQQYDQIVSDDSDIDLTYRDDRKFPYQQKAPAFGLNLNLQLPQTESVQERIKQKQPINSFRKQNKSSDRSKFDKTKLGFKLSSIHLTNQQPMNEEKQTTQLSSLGFKPGEETNQRITPDIQQQQQINSNLSGTLMTLYSGSKSHSFIHHTIGSSEYIPSTEGPEDQKQVYLAKRSSVIQQQINSENQQNILDDLLMIHSCVEQSCIVDANLYDDIGECSLSTDS